MIKLINYIYLGDDHATVIHSSINAKKHRHLFLQIMISSNRDFEIDINGENIKSKAIIIDTDIPHSVYSNEELILILIDNTSDLANKIRSMYLVGEKYFILDDYISENISSCLIKNYYPILTIEDYFKFIGDVCNIIGSSNNRGIPIDNRISKVLEEIKSCKQSKHNLQDYAKKVYLSESRLSHLFKENTGVAFSSYMVMHKLQKAMAYILGGRSITEASLIAGFDSPSHFAGVIKRMTGMSASEINKNSVFLKVTRY